MILRSHRRRVAALAALMLCLYGFLGFRLFQIQVQGSDQFRSANMKATKLLRPRGFIFDRNGNKFAVSLPVLSLYADPHIVEKPAEVAERLASLLHMDWHKLAAKLTSKRRFVWLARKLDRSVAERVRALSVPGLGFRQEYQRFYPKGTLAANVLGFVGMDGKGLEGLEYQHDDILASRPGEKLALVGLTGIEIPNGDVVVREPEGGANITLTIDEVIQHLCEREIEEIFANWQPKSCFIFVVEPFSGEVLACAVRPTFDPNIFSTYPKWSYKNRAITDMYEPGSVFKIVTAAAGLEDMRVQPETTFHCPGFIKLYGISIGCTSRHGDVTLRQAIEKSCNTAMAKVGLLLGPESLYYYIRKFGFGEETGIDLPGEIEGLVRLPKKWSGLSPAAISMGQEIGVTGIQMVQAVSTIANGGNLMVPHIIRRIETHDGQRIISQNEPIVCRRVVREKVAVELASMMERVVVQGTGRRGRLDLYTAAGKTGTSQKLGRGSEGKKVVSFAGFIPVHQPSATIYIVVNEPKGDKPSGGKVCAPVFRRLAGKIMLYLEVRPDRNDDTADANAAAPPAVASPLPALSIPSPSFRVRPMMDLRSSDPVQAVLDTAVAPLPGAGGVGNDPVDGNSQIGQVIDAALHERGALLGASGSASWGTQPR